MKEVLIAIAVHDTIDNKRTELTKRTIYNLIEQKVHHKHRIIVIDNGSCADTVLFLRSFEGQQIEVIWNEENIGTAKAINKAWIQRKPGQHCIKMDNDVIVNTPGWVEFMVECAEREPKLGQIGLKRKDCWEYPTHPDPNLRSKLIMLPHMPGEKWLVCEAVNHVIGTCVLHTSALLDAVGFLYQPSLYGWDDVLMSQRSHLAGFWNVHIPWIDIDHIDPGDTAYAREWKPREAGKEMETLNMLQKQYASGQRPIFELP